MLRDVLGTIHPQQPADAGRGAPQWRSWALRAETGCQPMGPRVRELRAGCDDTAAGAEGEQVTRENVKRSFGLFQTRA